MHTSPILPEVCNRTRMQASLRLDSELSELEEALMAAHLARCAACRSFAGDLETLTGTLRTAPLVEPSTRFELPRRTARVGVAYAGSAVAAAISVAGALIVGVSLHSSPSRISALDVQTARERISAKEQQLAALESSEVGPAPQTAFGLEAAEGTTLDPSRGAD